MTNKFDSACLSEDAFAQLCAKVRRVVFNDDFETFERSMWRMTQGNHQYAFVITRATCLRHGFDIDERVFDAVVAELTGGFEVEWLRLYCHRTDRQYLQLLDDIKKSFPMICAQNSAQIKKAY